MKAVPKQALDILTLITANNAIVISEKWNINDKPQLNIDFLIGVNEFLIPYTQSSVR